MAVLGSEKRLDFRCGRGVEVVRGGGSKLFGGNGELCGLGASRTRVW